MLKANCAGCGRWIVLALGTLAAAGCGAAERAELEKTRAELAEVRAELAKTKAELEALRAALPKNRTTDEVKEYGAKFEVKALTQAVEAYFIMHGEYPPSLATLTQPNPDGSKPYLQPEALKDPWGGQYKYNPAGPNNSGNRPDIWAVRPGTNKMIGNW
jgi:hypothetical protein